MEVAEGSITGGQASFGVAVAQSLISLHASAMSHVHLTLD